MTVYDSGQKTPLAQSLQKLTRAKAQDAIATLGRGLPCTVAKVISPGIVTVNFAVTSTPAALPQMTMPVGKPPYIDYPIQVGDIGIALSADVLTGGLSGLGLGIPNVNDTIGNLSAMTFFWFGTTTEEFIDAEALVLFQNIICTPTKLAFFGGGKVAKQTVSGPLSSISDSATKTVLTSIINALAAYGLVTNGTS